MERNCLFFAVSALTVLILSCSKSSPTDSGPCGPSKHDVYTVSQSQLTALVKPDYINTFYDNTGKYRVFQFSKTIENVCPDQHVSVTFKFYPLDNTITPRARVSWYIFWEEKAKMSQIDGLTWEGQATEIGLKQVYDSDPGSFDVYFEFLVPATADEFQDYTTFYLAFGSFTATSSYKEYKKS